MQKAALLMVLAVCSTWSGAQTPTNKSKTAAPKPAVKSKMSVSQQATVAAQAAAIAQAAAKPLVPVVPQVAPAPQLAPAPQVEPMPQASIQPTPVLEPSPTLANGVPSPEPAPAPVATATATATATANLRAAPVTAAAPALASAQVGAPHGAVSADELAISKKVHQGQMACELGASVRVEHDAAQPGFFQVQGKGFRYRMRPVVTSTGAIRLEDAKAGAVWLQLANKSMLMDQKKGRRVADDCAHPEQLAYAETMKTNPPPKLFDTTGMGR